MTTRTLTIRLASLLTACLLTVTNSFAEERFIVTDAEGYSTSLRMVDVKTLTQRIRTSRSTLQGQRDALAKQVAKQRFSSLDTLITIVMPGGLLYAAIKRGSQLEKRQDLAQLTQDINQLSGDLQSFEIAYGDLQIASLTH